MNILSLFDGMSCGHLALDRAGIKVDNYYASEIDKYADIISKKNYPQIHRLGDIKNWKNWCLPQIDLILAGSPCQGFSFAGKQLAFDDPRSSLFFDFVDILNHYKPKYFLLENVVMKQEFQDVISGLLGVLPIKINSALVSAQSRKRLYWTNIPGVGQPEDRGVVLRDILEDAGSTPMIKSYGVFKSKPDKAQCIDANYHKGVDNHGQRTVLGGRIVGRAYDEKGKRIDHKQSVKGITNQTFELNKDPGKANCLSSVQKDNVCIEVGKANLNGHDFLKRVYSVDGKRPTLTAVCGGNQERKIAVSDLHWRKLTPLECERLQTLPDNYTDGVSNIQRYKMVGNGWTVDVIAHILGNIEKYNTKKEFLK